jgi:tetratricopeptide (TPR) repeat protein
LVCKYSCYTIEERHGEMNNEAKSILSRDESKHPKCDYVNNPELCEIGCDKCAIHIKSDGDSALMSGNYLAAQKLYTKALKINQNFPEAWNNLGNAYLEQNKNDQALSAFSKALEIDNTYGKALLGKAITYENMGHTNAALIAYDDVLRLYNDPEVREMKQALQDKKQETPVEHKKPI